MSKKIIILGGGFGGLYVATELEKCLAADPDVEVTLVNRENFFLFTPMLHEWLPEHLLISSRAAEKGCAARYGWSDMTTSNVSTTANSRAPSGISLPSRPLG